VTSVVSIKGNTGLESQGAARERNKKGVRGGVWFKADVVEGTRARTTCGWFKNLG
jgi:hypothetical protein